MADEILREQVCQYRDELQRASQRCEDSRLLSAAFLGVSDRLNRILLSAPVQPDPEDTEPERCPTCGSDDPRYVDAVDRKGKPARFLWFDESILSDPDRAKWHCPDQFHGTVPDLGEEKGSE